MTVNGNDQVRRYSTGDQSAPGSCEKFVGNRKYGCGGSIGWTG
jgi:hypothetical protein